MRRRRTATRYAVLSTDADADRCGGLLIADDAVQTAA